MTTRLQPVSSVMGAALDCGLALTPFPCAPDWLGARTFVALRAYAFGVTELASPVPPHQSSATVLTAFKSHWIA